MPAPSSDEQRRLEKNLYRQVKKEAISASQKDETIARISTNLDLKSSVPVADLIIEAATENPGIKGEIFRTLDETAKPSAILATNTSSISITQIAAQTGRPDKVEIGHTSRPAALISPAARSRSPSA